MSEAEQKHPEYERRYCGSKHPHPPHEQSMLGHPERVWLCPGRPAQRVGSAEERDEYAREQIRRVSRARGGRCPECGTHHVGASCP